VLLAAVPGRLWAQAPAEPSSYGAAADTFQPTLDVGDLWRDVRHWRVGQDAEMPGTDAPVPNRFVVAAPSITAKPSTGLTAGFNSNVAFFGGDPHTTHISSLVAGVKVSQKEQVLSGLRFSIFTSGDRWLIVGDNRFSKTSSDVFGAGIDPPVGGENLRYDAIRLYETAYRTVRPHLFAGGGINVTTHSNTGPADGLLPAFNQSAYVAYSQQHGFSTSGQTSSGVSAGVLLDTRDNAINAEHGWLASVTYRDFIGGFFGGDASWQQLYVDVRTYRPLTRSGRQKLAFWFLSDNVLAGVAPYLDLPSTGSDGRSARGYTDGRYRGDHLVYGEVEYRSALTRNGLLGFVVFANTTTVDDPSEGQKLFSSFAPAGGTGLRVLMNKRSRTNLAADYGWGRDGSRGLYLGIQEAF